MHFSGLGVSRQLTRLSSPEVGRIDPSGSDRTSISRPVPPPVPVLRTIHHGPACRRRQDD